MKRLWGPLLVGCALTGCTTSAAGLAERSVRETITSDRSARSFATCAAETMIGSNELRGEGGHFWVLRMNGYGVPTIRWDFRDASAGGSVAELRASLAVGVGTDKVRECSQSPA